MTRLDEYHHIRLKVYGAARFFSFSGGADLHPYDTAFPYAFPHRLLPTVGASTRRLHVDRACRVNRKRGNTPSRVWYAHVDRRPVLCSFELFEGGSAYKKSLRKIRLCILHSSAASLPSIRVPRSCKHPRASHIASEWPNEFRTPLGPSQVTRVTVRVDIHTS